MIDERVKGAVGGVVRGVAEKISEDLRTVCGEQSGYLEKFVAVLVHATSKRVAVWVEKAKIRALRAKIIEGQVGLHLFL